MDEVVIYYRAKHKILDTTSNLSTLEKSEYYYYDSIWKDQIYYIYVSIIRPILS